MQASTIAAPVSGDGTGEGRTATHSQADVATSAHQAFWLLRVGFTAAPILFGIDKVLQLDRSLA